MLHPTPCHVSTRPPAERLNSLVGTAVKQPEVHTVLRGVALESEARIKPKAERRGVSNFRRLKPACSAPGMKR